MKSILFAKNLSELFFQLKSNKELTVVGGCTELDELPEKSISVYGIPDLSRITRHERFLEIGPGATLAQILAIGQTHPPTVLYEALLSIANPIIRNMATIGGNICTEGHRHTLFAPLLALDTKLEFRNQTETRIEPLQNFKKVPDGFVLTDIRIPLMYPEVSIFRRIGPEHAITQHSASFVFLGDTERNSLVDVKLAFAGPFVFRSKNLENSLIGHRLPLTKKDIDEIQNMVEQEFNKASTDQMISNVVRQQFLNLTRYSFEQLT